ncbi:MAG TPA: translocation/assembly module TamB domain-containing protein [Cyclobacteriaceae bacterium]|nr:translocation/assembly module TamB domain-containing protein [Cyclobacteriaceae bacterium]
MPGIKRVLIRIAKIGGWIVLSVVLLLIAAFLLIRLPSIQNLIVQKAVTSLSEKIGTKARIDKIYLSFPKEVVVTGIFLEDQAHDTLVSIGKLSIDTDLWGLLHNKIDLNEVGLESAVARLRRAGRDSAFNFDYIPKAFASPSPTTPDSTSKPWIISFKKLRVTNSDVKFIDSLNGTFARSRIGALNIDMDEFDLDRSVFKAGEILLSDVNASLTQSHQSSASTSPAREPQDSLPKIAFRDARFERVRFAYTAGDQVLNFNSERTVLRANAIDLAQQAVDLSEITVDRTFVQLNILKSEARHSAPSDPDRSSDFVLSPWKVDVARLDLWDMGIQYYDFNQPVVKGSLDLNHLWISALDFHVRDLKADSQSLGATIKKLSFQEKNGLSLRSLETGIQLKDHSFELTKFELRTDKTLVLADVSARFSSLASLSKNYADASITLKVRPSHVAVGDVVFFQPHLLDSLPVHISKSSRVQLETDVEGKVRDLAIRKFMVSALDSTYVEMNGSIKGLPDFDHAEMNISLNKIYSSKKDIGSLLPDSLKSTTQRFASWIYFKGDFKGSLKKPALDGLLVTNIGSVETHAKMDLDTLSKAANYSGRVKINDFHLGQVLGDTAVGRITMNASIAGSGLTMDRLNAKVDLLIDQFQYHGYNYADFKLKGSINKYFFSGDASIADKNLDMHLNADLNFNDEVPSYKLSLDLKVADLKALHLSERELKTRGRLDVNLATADFKRVNGNISIRKFGIFNGVSLYKVDSLLFASIDQDGNSEISIRSDIVTGDFKGTINLYGLPSALRRHFNNYFSLRDTAYNKPVAEQSFRFNLVLKDTDLLTQILLPGLEPFVPGVIKGEFSSVDDRLALQFGISRLKYTSVSVDSIKFDVISDKRQLNYALALKNLRVDTMRISGLKFSGSAANDSIRTRLTITDSLKKEKYVLGGAITSLEKEFQFRMLQNELLLNYEKWETPDDNYLRFGGTHMLPHNFEISKGRERVALEGEGRSDSVTALVFNNLNLENVTSLVEGVTPVGGIAEGDFTVSVARNESFTSRLKIHGFTILSQTWGDLGVSLTQKKGTPYNIDFNIEGEKAVVRINGTYSPDVGKPSLNLDARLAKLDLTAMQPLLSGTMKKMQGIVTGEMKVGGSIARPDINGAFVFKDALITPKAVNTAFNLKNETLTVASSSLNFKSFKIYDEKNKVATIDGTINRTKNLTFRLNLDIAAQDFQILNSTAKDNSLFYGKMSITTRMKVRGTMTQPKVTTDLSISDKSDFTFVVPQSEKGVQEQKGIVQWVDKDAYLDPFLATVKPVDTIKTVLSGIDLTANIELKDTETFNIVIDPATGDRLSIKGNSSLTVAMSPTGDMRLSGRYDITSGTYGFSFYKLVKRNFTISKGSYITWNGDPMGAVLDINAVYKIETAPLELILNQVSTSNTSELNTYKQRLPFLVDLNIKGELLSPDISFKLDMPPDKQNAFGGNIYAVIQDLNTREADLNKQVFALLVLQRFMTDNPLESESGEGLSGTARNSVSAILTQQLNRLSQNVKGVQLSFDVKSYQDYSSGSAQGNTQLQLGVSKSLLNDRLVVKVAGNVSVEGSAAPQNSASDYIGDLALEYKLTHDGRLRISGFRNSNYDMIDGELVETGAGLIYIKDYNAFSELFKANEKTP